MINLESSFLSEHELSCLQEFIDLVGPEPSVEQVWMLMDKVWNLYGLNNKSPSLDSLDRFYADPVWLLNGLHGEQHREICLLRNAIVSGIRRIKPSTVVDLGGGIGTLARGIAGALPDCKIDICEPYPTGYALLACKAYSNVTFVSELRPQFYDVVVCTDVLEHVISPVEVLACLVRSLRVGGHLFVANCFYPVIACHLPATFHLRYTFDGFCLLHGLKRVGPCHGSHAVIYQKISSGHPSAAIVSISVFASRIVYGVIRFAPDNLMPILLRARYAFENPRHYPRKAIAFIWRNIFSW